MQDHYHSVLNCQFDWLERKHHRESVWHYPPMAQYSSVHSAKPPLPNGTQARTSKGEKKQTENIQIAKTNKRNLFSNRVVSYDPERLQFVADLRAPVQDPGSIYILSSRFHRFFLKNVDPQDINTRILRVGGVTNPVPQHLQHGAAVTSTIPSQLQQYNFGNSIGFPTAPASPLLYKQELNVPSFGSKPINDIKSSFVDNFFNSIRQPYQYEPVGVINQAVKNPFTSLNMGERPEVFVKPRPQYTTFQKTSQSYGSLQQPILNTATFSILDQNTNYLTKLNPSFNDFNSLRRTKSIAFNSTALH